MTEAEDAVESGDRAEDAELTIDDDDIWGAGANWMQPFAPLGLAPPPSSSSFPLEARPARPPETEDDDGDGAELLGR